MSPTRRRVIYVIAYEIIAIALIAVALWALGFGGGGSTVLAVLSSTVALVWNFVWTSIFEARERRQESQHRTVGRRVVHSVGFEAGLIVIMVPLMAIILGVSLWEAFLLDIGLLLFFLVYTFAFAWIFDLIVPRQDIPKPQTEPELVK